MSNPATGSRESQKPIIRFALLRLVLLVASILSVVTVVSAQTPMPERPVFDVPRVDGIKIDGKFDDWGDRGLQIRALVPESGEQPDPKEFSGDFRLGWDDRGLLVAIRVHDASWLEERSNTALFHGDSIELFVAETVGSMNYQQVYIAPGMAADQPKLRHHTIDYNLDARNGATPTLEAERVAVTPHDYTMEVLFPWSNLGIKPHMGDKIGFEIYFNDAKEKDSKIVGQRHLVFFPATLTYANPFRMHCIRLTDKAGPPVLAAALGPDVPAPPVNLKIAFDPSLAGKTIELADGDTVLGSVAIPSSDAPFVPMTLAQPPMDKVNHWFTLRVDGVTVGHYRMGYPDKGLNDSITNPTAKQSVYKQGGNIDGFADPPPGLSAAAAVDVPIKKQADPKVVSWTLIIGIAGVLLVIAASGYGIYRAKRLSPLDI